MYAEVNKVLSSGFEEDIPMDTLLLQKLPMKSFPFQIQLKDGLVRATVQLTCLLNNSNNI